MEDKKVKNITYKMSSLGEAVHNDPNDFLFLRTCVGAGKTTTAIWDCFFEANKQEPGFDGVRRSRTAVVRAAQPRLLSTVVPTFLTWFDKVATCRLGKSPLTATVRCPCVSGDGTMVEWELFFLALDVEEDVEKLKSIEFTNALFSEAKEMRKIMFDTMIGRIGRYPPPAMGAKATHPKIICEYNSPPIDHWLAQLELGPDIDGYSFHHSPPAVIRNEDGTYETNPEAINLEFLPEGYYKRQLQGTDEGYINVMLMNNFGSMRSDKPVFNNYSDEIHCASYDLPALQGVPIIVGLDLGLTPAAAIGQLSPAGQLLVLDEIVEFDMGLEEFIETRLKPKMMTDYPRMNFRVVVDPAAVQRVQTDAKSCYDLLRKHGLPTQTASSNNLVDRLGAVDFFLRRRDGFMLSPRANTVRKGMISEYKYEKVRSTTSDRYHDKPSKNDYSHVMDAVQYLALECQSPKQQRTFTRRPQGNRSRVASTIAGY